MAERWLDKYRDEVFRLYQDQRMTQADIRRHLDEHYNIQVPKTTLSNYLRSLPAGRQLPAPGTPRVSPEEERFLEQYEVFEVLRQGQERLIDLLTQVHARMGVLEDAAAERGATLQQRLQAFEQVLQEYRSVLGDLQHRPDTPGETGTGHQNVALSLDVIIDELKKQRQTLEGVPGFRRPRVWWRALLLTALTWGAALAAYFLWWR